ncbi:MAG: GntR family transcriptional regulator [Mesorhizobium sp.]
MNPFIPSSKLDTQASRVYRMLEAQIVQGELVPGQELSERSISAQFRIGRTPVREALQKLAANHMVQVEPRRGTFVSRIDPDIATELFLVVWPLEKLLIRCAIDHASEEEFKQLGALAVLLTSTHEDDNQTSLYAKINDQIAQMARNSYLLAVLAPMRLLVERVRFFHGLARDLKLRECFADLIAQISLQDKAGSMTAFTAYADRFETKAMTEISRRQ